jgi:hypothetical protein
VPLRKSLVSASIAYCSLVTTWCCCTASRRRGTERSTWSRRSASPPIRQMAAEKRLWDQRRIQAELAKLGFSLRHTRGPSSGVRDLLGCLAFTGAGSRLTTRCSCVVSGRSGKTPHQIEGRPSGSLFRRSRDRWSRHSPRRCAASASTWAS